MELGYAFSSEEHAPQNLVAQAVAAEEAGFRFGFISDHYHPWIDAQGHGPFVWSVIGAIANATDELTIGTGVTCPTIRIHPAIIAQAAATCACLMPGRFILGVGTGENLNEHILGDKWPASDEQIVDRYRDAGGDGPVYAQFHACWSEDEQEARKLAHKLWPTAGLQGAASQELALPEHFEQAAGTVTEDDVAESVVVGPDPDRYLEKIEEFGKAGATHVYIHQIGPDQDGFLGFCREAILPRLTAGVA